MPKDLFLQQQHKSDQNAGEESFFFINPICKSGAGNYYPSFSPESQ
jgi:hypothetical protein